MAKSQQANRSKRQGFNGCEVRRGHVFSLDPWIRPPNSHRHGCSLCQGWAPLHLAVQSRDESNVQTLLAAEPPEPLSPVRAPGLGVSVGVGSTSKFIKLQDVVLMTCPKDWEGSSRNLETVARLTLHLLMRAVFAEFSLKHSRSGSRCEASSSSGRRAGLCPCVSAPGVDEGRFLFA